MPYPWAVRLQLYHSSTSCDAASTSPLNFSSFDPRGIVFLALPDHAIECNDRRLKSVIHARSFPTTSSISIQYLQPGRRFVLCPQSSTAEGNSVVIASNLPICKAQVAVAHQQQRVCSPGHPFFGHLGWSSGLACGALLICEGQSPVLLNGKPLPRPSQSPSPLQRSWSLPLPLSYSPLSSATYHIIHTCLQCPQVLLKYTLLLVSAPRCAAIFSSCTGTPLSLLCVLWTFKKDRPLLRHNG